MANNVSKICPGHLATGILFCTAFLFQTSTAQTTAPASAASAATASAGTGPTAASFPVLAGLKGDHVTISVENLDREVAWFERELGFKPTAHVEHPDRKSVHVENGNYRIDLMKYNGSKRTPADPIYLQQGYVHLALSVPDLAAAGAALKTIDPSATVSATTILVRDPEGNEIEIFPQKK